MERNSVKDHKLKSELYNICFKDFTIQNTLLDKRAKMFEGITIISLISVIVLVIVLGLLITVWNLDIRPVQGIFILLTILFVLIISLLSILATTYSSRIHIKSQHKELAFMIGTSKFKLDSEVLFSIRCDQVYQYLKNYDYDQSTLDDLISYYSSEGETTKKNGWIPFAIFTAFVFPFWNESVSKYLDWESFEQVVTLILFATLLPLGVWIWRKNIEIYIFSKSNNYLELAKILRTVRSFPKI